MKMTYKKFVLIFFLCFIIGSSGFAQPSIIVSPEDVFLPDVNENASLEFSVFDFTDLTFVSFDIFFDPDKVVLVSHLIPFNTILEGYTIADIDVSDAINGHIRFEWQDPTPNQGEDLNDETVLFVLNFESVDNLGSTDIDIVEDIVRRDISGNLNIGLYDFDGYIQIGVRSVILNCPTIAGEVGELVCLNISVENFWQLITIQFSIQYDENALEFVSASGVNPMEGGTFDFANPSAGVVSTIWYDLDGLDGVTIDDGSQFIEVCFNIIGDCNTNSDLLIKDEPTSIEATTDASNDIDNMDPDVGIDVNNGQIIINCSDPNAPSVCLEDIPEVCPGDQFDICFSSENIQNIRTMNFSFQWNPSVLSLVEAVESNVIPFFEVQESGYNSGFSQVNWQSNTALNLIDGTEMGCLTFDVIGGANLSTAISIANAPTEILFSNQNGANPQPLGYNSCNVAVEICDPPGILIDFESSLADANASTCIDVTAQGFSQISEFELSMSWSTNILEYSHVENFGLSNMNGSNFDESDASLGILCLDWDLDGGTSLPSGATLFSLCFDTSDEYDLCSEIFAIESPCGISATHAETGLDVMIESNTGEVCIDNPFEVEFNIGSDEGIVNDVVCLNVQTNNFISVEHFQYSINWNPSLLQFVEINSDFNPSDLNSDNFNDTNASNGILTVDYSVPNNGITLENNSTIFQLCYRILDATNQCIPINITSNPLEMEVIVSNSNDNQGFVSNNGEVCLVQALSPQAQITNSFCSNPQFCNGEIDVTVNGGSGNNTFEWSGPSINASNQNNEDQTNLCAGEYNLFIEDETIGYTSFQSYTIENDPMGTYAYAGADTTLNCNIPSIELDVTNNGTTTGPDYSYFWYSGEGNAIVLPDNETSLTPNVSGNGEIIFRVTNNASGCIVFDTLVILSTQVPITNAGPDLSLDCTTTQLEVVGMNSDNQSEFQILWTPIDGGCIQTGMEISLETVVECPGNYELSITNPNNFCVGRDTMFVVDDTTIPEVVASANNTISCDNEYADLDGVGSSQNGSMFSYEWTTQGGALVSTNISSQTDNSGWHFLTVTNTETQCIASDSVFVNMDLDIPNGAAGPSRNLDCSSECITIEGQEPMQSGNFSYNWVGTAGQTVTNPTSITPEVCQPGSYHLTITNDDTGCDAVFSMTVIDMTSPPPINAGNDLTINCEQNQVQAQTNTPNNLIYSWVNIADQSLNGIVPGTETLANASFNLQGTYRLTVTDNATQCINQDEISVNLGDMDPIIDISSESSVLNCDNPSIPILTNSSTQGGDYIYTWTGPCELDLTDTLSPISNCAGTFTLTISHATLNCEASQDILFSSDFTNPVLNYQNPLIIPCSQNSIQLNDLGSSIGSEFQAIWFVIGEDGEIEAGTENQLIATFNTTGTYGITYENTENGCTVMNNLQVVSEAIMADAGEDQILSCDNGFVLLNGEGSTPGLTYAWTNQDNNTEGIESPNEINTNVSLVGIYTLTVSDSEGDCITTAMVEVTAEGLPNANAGEDQIITCLDDSITLDGSQSDDNEGTTLLWTTIDGNIINDPNQAIIEIDEPGTYNLQVTNVDNCVNDDIIIVTEELPLGLVPASAEITHDSCQNNAMGFANLPVNTTGTWSSSSAAVIFENVSAPETNINNIPSGDVLITWTLSSANCIHYSSADSVLTKIGTPTLQNDIFTPDEDETSININLIENDNLEGILDYTLNLTSPSNVGMLVPTNTTGVFTYDIIQGSTGLVTFSYEICPDLCPNLCEEANGIINLSGELDLEQLPNTITPNNDGLNDVLIFDIIDLRPNDFPDNSLTVFNRYGEEVFHAKPYLNDWGGKGPNGTPLPEATYYYVLRLDLGSGLVAKGDITILR